MMQVCSEHCLATAVLADKPDAEHQVSYPVHVIDDDAVANDMGISNVDAIQVANNDRKQDKIEQVVCGEARDDDEHHNKVETMHEHKYNVHELQPVVKLMVGVNELVEDEKLVPGCVVKKGTMAGDKSEMVVSEEVEGEKSEEEESQKMERVEMQDKSQKVESEKIEKVESEKIEKVESEEKLGDVEGNEKAEVLATEDKMEHVDKEKKIQDGNAEDVSVEKTQKVNADQTEGEGVDVKKMEKVKSENNKQFMMEDVVADEDERIVSGKIVHVMPENMDEMVYEKIDVKEDVKVHKTVASSAKQVQDNEMK